MNRKKLPSVKKIKETFDYDKKTGNLIWKNIKKKKSKIAGRQEMQGYIVIYWDGELYKAHRIIWKLFNKTVPDSIDHINRIRSDNRIENLRGTTPSRNAQNSYVRKNNSTGYKGVHFYKEREKYTASIRINGKKKHLGYFDDKESAHKAYCLEAAKQFGEYHYE